MAHDGVVKDFNNSNNAGIRVCTNATKPNNPFEGQHIYVTDATAGQELQSWNGSSWDIVGSGGGGGSGVTNPMTADLATGGYKIKNTGGAVTFESATGVFIFMKPA